MAPFDLDACIEQLRNKQLLGEALLREICEKTKEVLMRESNVVHVSSPVTVVGDIHGQFHDLIEIFRIGGPAPNTNYLFLGAWGLGNSNARRLCRPGAALGGNDFPVDMLEAAIPRPDPAHPREPRVESCDPGELDTPARMRTKEDSEVETPMVPPAGVHCCRNTAGQRTDG